jgi:very-short-patch-repair endonuclease
MFDLLIIDEASQCDIPSALPLLLRAKRVLVIGDPQQLRHISTLPTDDEMALASEHGVLDSVSRWSYNQRSLYGLSEDVASQKKRPVWFLAEHYRSHPEIIEFSNRSFYQGKLILRTLLPRLQERIPGHEMGVFWIDTPGAVARSPRSAVNVAEVAGIIDLITKWTAAGLLSREDLSLGVVTPFRLQMEKVREAIVGQPWPEAIKDKITVGTAHRFQGDECDIMIFSPVVARGMSERLVRWVATTDQLLNVAITRARAALHVVGDMSACLAAGGRLGDFAASIQKGIRVGDESQVTETAPEQEIADMLTEMGIWHASQYQVGGYRLDFLVVSPQGIRYDLEIDGRGHLTDEAVRSDERRDSEVKALGFKVIRIDARLVFFTPSTVKKILLRMC